MAWYRTSTLSVTNGSTAVTGSGTAWITNVGIGEALLAPDGRLYEITNVASDTSITLGSPYLGSTQTGQAYVIVPSQSYIRDLAAQAAALVNNYSTFYSTVGQGKFPEGTLAAPAVAFSADTNTGFYHSAADEVTLVAGGVAIAKWGPTGFTILNSASVNIDGGTIDGTVIGGTTPAAVNATTLSSLTGVTVTDWNSALTNAIVMAADAANAPEAGWFIGDVVAHNSDYVSQTVWRFTAGSDAPKYRRTRTGGTWSSWIHQGLWSTSGLSVTGALSASTVHAGLQQATHSAGAYLEWNKSFGDGATWLLNQKGGGVGGVIVGEVDAANAVTQYALFNSTGLSVTGALSTTDVYTAKRSSNATAIRIVQDNSDAFGWGLQADSATGYLKFNRWYANAETASPLEVLDIGVKVTGALSATGTVTLPAVKTIAGSCTGWVFSSVTGGWGGGINPTNSMNIGTESNSPLVFGTNNIGQATLDAAGNLGLGVTPSAWTSGKKVVQVKNSYYGAYNGPEPIAYIGNNHYDNGTVNVYSVSGYNATLYRQTQGGAHTFSASASGTAGAAVTFTQVLSVEKDKTLALQGATSQTGAGLSFPATQVASSDANTLDDYEEGVFTPGITFGGSATGITTSASSGNYTKIGRVVYVAGVLTLTSKGGLSGAAVINGLPFTVGNNLTGTSMNGIIGSLCTVGGTALADFSLSPNASGTTLIPYNYTGGTATQVVAADVSDSFSIRFSGHYTV